MSIKLISTNGININVDKVCVGFNLENAIQENIVIYTPDILSFSLDATPLD